MKWTTEAPRQGHAGLFFWLKVGDCRPEVVLIVKWSGKSTAYAKIADCLNHNGDTVYLPNYCVAHNAVPSALAEQIEQRLLWAGPIEAPEE